MRDEATGSNHILQKYKKMTFLGGGPIFFEVFSLGNCHYVHVLVRVLRGPLS